MISNTRHPLHHRRTYSSELALQLQTFVICQEYSNVCRIQSIAYVKPVAASRSFEHLLKIKVLCLYRILHFCKVSTISGPAVCFPTPHCVVKNVCFDKACHPLQCGSLALQQLAYIYTYIINTWTFDNVGPRKINKKLWFLTLYSSLLFTKKGGGRSLSIQFLIVVYFVHALNKKT